VSGTLERAVEAPEIVQALRGFGVSQSDVGAVTGVSDRAVRGWASSQIRPDRYDRLADVRDIALILSDSLSPRGVGQWLHARNRLLEGRRPLEVLADGSVEEVRQAAQAFVDGAYV
jgi:hypothetical protein